MCFYFISVLFLHFLVASLAMTSRNLSTDQSALLAFKKHITDPQGVLATSWSVSNPVCSWVGISCGSRHGRVTAIELPSMNLGGTIPPHLGNLSFLKYISFHNNNFYGHLPDELGQLRRMRTIIFSGNNLAGGFPQWIGNLSTLQCLSLSNNSLTGPIPQSLFNLSKLETLMLSNNSIGGTIPSEIEKLPNLKQFYMPLNKLSGSIPSTFFNVASLQVIVLSENDLSGSLPNDICNRLPKLEHLYLSSNKLSGKLPASLGDCSELQDLNLRDNNFTGRIPESIGNLSKLMYLDLGNNDLRGEMLDKVGNLQNLEYLGLRNNSLEGLIPPTIFNISTIEVIDLDENDLTGHLPSSIGHYLPNLKRLQMAGNKLSGTIPNSISNASKLIILQLSANSFSGFIPTTFGNLRHLRCLNLGYNNLTTESSTEKGSFLSSLTSCRELEHLGIEFNPLNGILPPSIGNFSSSLRRIYADDCKLMGSIPAEIGNLQSLIILSLANNDLNGPIPKTMGRLRNLQGLFLNHSDLQGSIPNDLCYLRSLHTLSLNGNKLSGRIPACFESVTSLRNLDMSSNNFTSTIPSFLWTLQYILHVNLSSNSFKGSLSSNIQNLAVLITIDFSRNQLSGSIPNNMGGLKDLFFLSLANNKFQGYIPKSFGALISLEFLDLSDNNLYGEIPKSLEALSNLKHFNVSLNRLEGEIPTKGPFGNFSYGSFMLNHALCGSPQLQVPPCKGSMTTTTVILKYILPPLMSTVLVVIVIFCMRCHGRHANSQAPRDMLPLAKWRRTSYLEIQQATNDFSECNLLGTGSFGSVYKGTLLDGTNIAVKVYNLQLQSAFKSFDSECEVFRNIRHRNLIKVFSSCCNKDFKALILEFISNGNLEKWLYSHNYFLDVLKRLNIMIDIASALEYLHHGHSTPIVHCDLKPNNILLDKSMVAYVSDFGISKLLGEGDSMTQTMTLATIGYMAPEYGSMGNVSPKCDVYSYGILIVEVFTRKKPTDEMFVGGMTLKQWVKDSMPHAVTEVVDANLLQDQSVFSTKVDCILSIMNLALECCMESPEQRINMKDALAKLQKIKMKFVKDVKTT